MKNWKKKRKCKVYWSMKRDGAMELESWVQIEIMSNILEISKIDIMGKILLFLDIIFKHFKNNFSFKLYWYLGLSSESIYPSNFPSQKPEIRYTLSFNLLSCKLNTKCCWFHNLIIFNFSSLSLLLPTVLFQIFIAYSLEFCNSTWPPQCVLHSDIRVVFLEHKSNLVISLRLKFKLINLI